MRRLIILALEPGADPEIDWEGDFAYWEILAALSRAHDIIEDRMYDEELGPSGEGEG